MERSGRLVDLLLIFTVYSCMFFFSLFIFSQLSGVFLHVMADTLGSIGVIISAGLIYQFGKLFCWYIPVYCSTNLLWLSNDFHT